MKEQIAATYHGDDAQAIVDTFGKAWARGESVTVKVCDTEYPFFDFLILARADEQEPAEWIARYIATRRAMQRSYMRCAYQMARKYAQTLGKPAYYVRKMVSKALSELVDGAVWR